MTWCSFAAGTRRVWGMNVRGGKRERGTRKKRAEFGSERKGGHREGPRSHVLLMLRHSKRPHDPCPSTDLPLTHPTRDNSQEIHPSAGTPLGLGLWTMATPLASTVLPREDVNQSARIAFSRLCGTSRQREFFVAPKIKIAVHVKIQHP
jgi:hypothetical protein